MKRSSPTRAYLRFPAVGTFLLVVLALYFGREVLMPLALAAMVTFLLAPLVRRLERAKLPRVAAVIVTVGAATFFVGGIGWIVELQAVGLADKLSDYRTGILEKVRSLRPSGSGLLGRTGNLFSEMGKELAKPSPGPAEPAADKPVVPTPVKVVENPTPPLRYLSDLLGPVLTRVATAGVIIVFSIFMLVYREDLRSRLLMLIGERHIAVSTPALDEAGRRVTRYLVMQSLSNAITGGLIGIGMFALGIPNAALWGLVIALLRFVPYLGVWIGAALPITLSLAVSPGWNQPLLTFGLVLIVEVGISNILEPLLLSSGTGLSPLAVLGSAVFWAWLWGPAGLLLSTPLTVCLAVLGGHVPQLRYLEILLSDKPALRPEAQLYQRVLAGDLDESIKLLKASPAESAAEVYDTLLIPALRLCEDQKDGGNLDELHETAVMDLFHAAIEDVALRAPTANAPASVAPGLVLCIPAQDRADELAAAMLMNVLSSRNREVRMLSPDQMMGEILEEITKLAPVIVCVSALPHGPTLYARVLCKRIRAQFPNLPLIAGIWGGAGKAQQIRLAFGTDITEYVVTTVAQAADKIQSLTFSPLPSNAESTAAI